MTIPRKILILYYSRHGTTAELVRHVGQEVWDEAENRLHAQKALIEFLLSGG